MTFKRVTPELSVSAQIRLNDLQHIKEQGFKSIVCNRPDGEGADQISFAAIEKQANNLGLNCHYLPVVSSKVTDDDIKNFENIVRDLPKPILAYCRTGTRSITLWAMSAPKTYSHEEILNLSQKAGYDLSGVIRRLKNNGETQISKADFAYPIVIIGAGAGGVAVAASIKSRSPESEIVIIEPNEIHYYQPGWTLVGRGVFTPEQTVKTTASVIPDGVKWLKGAAAAFIPDENLIIIDGCRTVKYEHLVVCPGIKLDWHKIDGLSETLGENGVTSNYRYDLAPYTWELVQNLKKGKAVFSQPPMPIKCAGAPQKAMYLSSDYWFKNKVINNIDVEFYNKGEVLFGVKEYVPALLEYIKKYDVNMNFNHELIAVDGKQKIATFKVVNGENESVEKVKFDMLHVVPPQSAPDFIKVSPLVDENGWIDVDQSTLQHKKFSNIFALGDATNAPNAKTAAAARMQAPVVATNLLYARGLSKYQAIYNGYGSCPLTVELGKVVLAEFGYGGKVMNSFPSWIINGKRPSRLAWLLKEKLLPPIYWLGMLKGREWMAKPEKLSDKSD
ncbi:MULTISPECIES: bifunctional protein tyrosine phosphatase family protein/NAD(P)/FAD-dependent oxidoreductase [Pseudoalteromonas]|uniref:bifunctional protein tyrosine phosphatase family protein/NAD(P)/FAD-dependent oxidoreductase n=1 Tax=Pseudoalteromonas TaxID=53246 RepID=UPI000C3C830D|nr:MULTISPECIES: bifunctional protein tyrosine phosphatase family protein/NAD(P)/FAD-dependent oxidoreductase [Pseudoalteromonas]MAY58154.1 TIGR01244 family phosphatase [Pseudoalteromonas sp.]MDN3409169.1 TIGR01244 family sulfur transferase [Pseudoalteromonas sp. APC 3894]MDN3416574.1 TIGR01244 family sulfur transferase [Pseudoalteromonas sp. APC 3227]MDN3420271.1 TIGR01244 family sulfur transferase [Pseudoalteromonas sp. APC 3895]MDN3423845.1 TIGR01244 family sulfur transferase [Pseudoalterom|tara:strand:+ start:4581 stop:6257 length:1677 start_codon:yes stop_codon:yes gene_type:complete